MIRQVKSFIHPRLFLTAVHGLSTNQTRMIFSMFVLTRTERFTSQPSYALLVFLPTRIYLISSAQMRELWLPLKRIPPKMPKKHSLKFIKNFVRASRRHLKQLRLTLTDFSLMPTDTTSCSLLSTKRRENYLQTQVKSSQPRRLMRLSRQVSRRFILTLRAKRLRLSQTAW